MYRVLKHEINLIDCNPVIIYMLQYTGKGQSWYTLNASSFLADIKHACFEGRNQSEKIHAYNKFMGQA